jgi:hypothetical protein
METCSSILEQAQLESEMDVYPYTGENNFIQLCTHDHIAVGGGSPGTEKREDTEAEKKEDPIVDDIQSHELGFGLLLLLFTLNSEGLCTNILVRLVLKTFLYKNTESSISRTPRKH